MIRNPDPSPAAPATAVSIRDSRLASRLVVGLSVLVTGLGALPHGAAAQTPGREPAVLEMAPGARTLGLGLAPQLGGPDPDVAFIHPALAPRGSGIQMGYTHLGGASTGFSLSAAGEGLDGGIVLSVHTLSYVGTGPGARTEGLDDFLEAPPGGLGVHESAATLSYGRTLFGVRLGVSGRLYTQRFDTERVTRESVDVGAAQAFGPVQVALSVRNLGSDELLPREVVLGAGGYGQPLGPLDLGLAAQVRYRDDGEFVVGGGAEFGYWPVRGRTFVGRVGLRNVPEGEALPVTLGGSFWGDNLVLDYAYQPVDGLDGIHRISVAFR